MLSQPHAGRSQEDGDALAALLAKGALYHVQFRCEDLDATFDKIAAAPGVEVLQEPVSQSWGVRDFAVRDPAGNMVRVDQELARICVPGAPHHVQRRFPRWPYQSVPIDALMARYAMETTGPVPAGRCPVAA